MTSKVTATIDLTAAIDPLGDHSPKKPRCSIETVSTVSTAAASAPSPRNEEEEEVIMPWEEDEEWVPCTKSGKQKTPKQIRNEIQKYIDECKANKTFTQTEIVKNVMGLTYSSFSTFMNPKSYKDQWKGVQNSTYWAAAKLLERVKIEKEQAKKAQKKSKSGKRKSSSTTTTSSSASSNNSSSVKKAKTNASATTTTTTKKKTKAQMKAEAEELIQRIQAVEGVYYNDPKDSLFCSRVYDTCPQVVAKIKNFLQRDGMTKTLLLKALGNKSASSMSSFLAGKKQDQQGNVIYREAYVFFERLRILEGQPKSKARLKNESENPNGFSIQAYRGTTIKWFAGCGY